MPRFPDQKSGKRHHTTRGSTQIRCASLLAFGFAIYNIVGYHMNFPFPDPVTTSFDAPVAAIVHDGNGEQEEKPQVLFLKTSTASVISKQQQQQSRRSQQQYTIDVLIIGSKNNIERARAQRETWASHEAVRHFFLSTEDDDVDPICHQSLNKTEAIKYVSNVSNQCKNKNAYWKKKNLVHKLTDKFRSEYARVQWLEKKANAMGWVCVQRRFVTSLTELVEMYAAAATADNTTALPDYLIFGDDDTYVNIDHIIELFLENPARQKDAGMDLEAMVYPPKDVPVVTAGCRVDKPVPFNFPFGGYGVFFSRGSLQKLIQPLQCYGDNNHEGVCQKLLNKTRHEYPISATIGEEDFYEVGDTLNQVFYKYTREVEYFCLHSDHMVGYMANFYNLSRHSTNASGFWFHNTWGANQEVRLHMLPNSQIYRKGMGECLNSSPSKCGPNATVCHGMNSTSFRNLHSILREQNK